MPFVLRYYCAASGLSIYQNPTTACREYINIYSIITIYFI